MIRSSASSIDLTPGAPVPLAGRGHRSRPFAVIADPLECNAIALPGRDGAVVLVGCDTLFASAELEAAISAALPESARSALTDLVIVASHTHNAPSLDPTKPALGAVDPEYFDFAVRQIAAAVTTAVATLDEGAEACTIALGQSRCNLNARRRKFGPRLSPRFPFVGWGINPLPVHDAEIPRAFDAVVARNAAGEPVWVLWHWCCHATSTPDQLKVSADFPGRVRTWLRKTLDNPDLPVVFIPGLCGDIRPDPVALPVSLANVVRFPFQRPFADASDRASARLASNLCQTAHEALTTSVRFDVNDKVETRCTDVAVAGLSRAGRPVTFSVRTLNLGTFGLLLMGAEVCSSYAAPIARLLPDGWIATGCAGPVFGYLADSRQLADGGYEADGFVKPFGLDGRADPAIERDILRAISALVPGSTTGTAAVDLT